MSHIQLLREKCLAALGDYTRAAEKTFELFGDADDREAPIDLLLAIWAQAQAENETCKRFLVLRQRLFQMLSQNKISDQSAPTLT